jgi:aldehyde dehydrogenase (NAD+)
MKVPAALAAANTVVIKPPEVAPFGSEVFIDLLRRAGFRPASSTSYPGTPRRGGL